MSYIPRVQSGDFHHLTYLGRLRIHLSETMAPADPSAAGRADFPGIGNLARVRISNPRILHTR